MVVSVILHIAEISFCVRFSLFIKLAIYMDAAAILLGGLPKEILYLYAKSNIFLVIF